MGALVIGFAVMDGFDLGVGILLPFVGRNDNERRVILNSVGPHWDGNQVWLVTAAGAIFAAWPLVYATAFSGFYGALIIMLFALFLRPVGFDFRSKVPDPRWRNAWDWGIFIAGAVPTLVFGVVFGNLLLGVPFHFDDTMRVFYTGNFFGLLNPFGILCGVVSLAMLIMHGGIYLQLRSDSAVCARARNVACIAAIILIVTFALAGVWIAYGIDGYRIVSMPDPDSAFTPLAKVVEKAPGAWLANYTTWPWMIAAPAIGFGGALLALLLSTAHRTGLAFIASALSVIGVTLTAGFSLFPFIMPSSTNPASSLTIWDAVSSQLTLGVMFWATVILLPLIMIYTSWAFHVMRGTITTQHIAKNEHSAY
jgi:cytochrome d ubiquinol oxidase subunit II